MSSSNKAVHDHCNKQCITNCTKENIATSYVDLALLKSAMVLVCLTALEALQRGTHRF